MMETIAIVIGKRIKQLRRERNLTQSQLSAMLNVSRSCLANYETGKRMPDADILSALSTVFHIEMQYLTDPGCLFIRYSTLTDTQFVLDLREFSPQKRNAMISYYRYLSSLPADATV